MIEILTELKTHRVFQVSPLSLTAKLKNSATPLIATTLLFYFFKNVESRFYLDNGFTLPVVVNFAFNGIFKSR